jgi:hypothetical protein
MFVSQSGIGRAFNNFGRDRQRGPLGLDMDHAG